MPRPHPITPGPGQESVWSSPRPPRLEATPLRTVVGDAAQAAIEAAEQAAAMIATITVLSTTVFT